MNISGCTPLDVSMEYESGLGRLRTDWALITAGANKVGSIPGRKKTRILKKNHGSWFMEALLVVNILMITVLFQAALNPPGGIWQDTGYENVTLPSTRESSPRHVQVHHYAGQSVMSYVDPLKYKDFFMRNNISLISSMLVIEILLIRCFFNNWFLDLAPVFLTSISVVTIEVLSGLATAVTEDRAWGVSCCSHEDPDLLWPEKLWLEKKKRDDSDGSLASLCFNSKLQSEQKIEIFVCIDLQRESKKSDDSFACRQRIQDSIDSLLSLTGRRGRGCSLGAEPEHGREEKKRTKKGKKGFAAASSSLPEKAFGVSSVPIATCLHCSRRRQRNPVQGFI
ncbi:hypothetical protein MRB53_022253 [Persea americana]|uniref:Uncharacterized protein n=1 Tax=Persea americana TaxID=3435 RepID=A0ACC2L6F4_PERAE|nr:hypothetical protein MRB53_022253 [Persea americana]